MHKKSSWRLALMWRLLLTRSIRRVLPRFDSKFYLFSWYVLLNEYLVSAGPLNIQAPIFIWTENVPGVLIACLSLCSFFLSVYIISGGSCVFVSPRVVLLWRNTSWSVCFDNGLHLDDEIDEYIDNNTCINVNQNASLVLGSCERQRPESAIVQWWKRSW